jgi:hypothetical protein
MKFQNRRIGFERSYCQQHCQHHTSVWVWGNHIETTVELQKPKLDISTVARSLFMRKIKTQKLKIYTITLYEINKALAIQGLQENPLEEVIPKNYHESLPLFSKVVMEILPPHQPYNHKIKLQDNFTPLFGPI